MYEKSSAGQVLFIRHGETDYNKQLLTKKDDEIKRLQTNETYLDCSLSEEGVKQANSLQTKLQSLKIKYVFTSPLNRCLETTYNALRMHPDRDNFVVYVNPFISEIVHGAQDIPKDIKQKKTIYNDRSEVKFDWTLFDLYVEGPQEYYFLNYIDNKSFNNANGELDTIIENLTSQNNLSGDGFYSKLLSFFILNNQRPESLSHLFKRAKTFKIFLKKFLYLNVDKSSCLSPSKAIQFPSIDMYSKPSNGKSEDEAKHSEGKTLVITHSAFIRMASSQAAYEMEKIDAYPNDCYRPDNCEVVTINI